LSIGTLEYWNIKQIMSTDFTGYFPTWCPGCGNFGIWGAIKQALKKLNIAADQCATVFGIGCSGNMNDFLWSTSLHSLHGRSVPTAVGIKLANHDLPVLVVAGDGDCYGEGGNHLIHAARGNHDITVIVHDNRVYGLTTGQVSPTAKTGFSSKSTPKGSIETELNPIALAITQGASFVGQGFAGDMLHLSDLIADAISHKGFSLVNIFQPCVSFNKVTTYEWYRQRVYKVSPENHDKADIKKALDKSLELEDKLPIGIIYESQRPTYTSALPQLANGTLVKSTQVPSVETFIKEFI
jgi:2-oxoglutarate/2-oxoacid ferredoxin oxidoreductase subunit beta